MAKGWWEWERGHRRVGQHVRQIIVFFFFFPEHATDYSEFVGVKFWGRSPLTLLGQHFHSCRVSYFQLTGNGPGGEEFEPIDVKAHLWRRWFGRNAFHFRPKGGWFLRAYTLESSHKRPKKEKIKNGVQIVCLAAGSFVISHLLETFRLV